LDGRFSPIMRKRVARHVDQCDVCADRRRIAVSPWALLAGVPLLPAPLFLRDRVMAEVQLAAMDVPTEQHPTTDHGEGGEDGEGGEGGEGQGGTGQGAGGTGAGAGTAAGAGLAAEAVLAAEESDRPPAGGPFSSRRAKVTAAAAAVLALLVAGMALGYWRDGDQVEGKPLALENSVARTTTGTTRTTTSVPTTTVPTTTPGPTTTTRQPTTRRTTTTTRPVTTTTNVVQPPPPPPPPGDTTAPVVTSASAEPTTVYAAYCQQSPAETSVQATASDDVGVTSVTLTWSGSAGSGSAAMSRDGNIWYSGMGGFTRTGDVSWRVTATDAAGNTSEPRSGRITVRDCDVIG
jgi:hypothetical protein